MPRFESLWPSPQESLLAGHCNRSPEPEDCNLFSRLYSAVCEPGERWSVLAIPFAGYHLGRAEHILRSDRDLHGSPHRGALEILRELAAKAAHRYGTDADRLGRVRRSFRFEVRRFSCRRKESISK